MHVTVVKNFVVDALKYTFKGSFHYYIWVFVLLSFIGGGLIAYSHQFQNGLQVTGMHDYVSWGFYISNFTFLVGMAAAAVMLVLPTYIFKEKSFNEAVLIGEAVAVSALTMCLLFVTVDLGRPDRFWHMIPMIGYFNLPSSMLAWDVIVLNGYLALNIGIPAYMLYCYYQGKSPDQKKYVPFIFLSVGWAFCLHLVTAFLYAGLPAKAFWNSGLLGPRFLASAFAAGPAFIIVVILLIRSRLNFNIRNVVIEKLALITAVAAQANLVMLGSEIFKEFYHETEHSLSAKYMFFGIGENDALVGWIWTAVVLNVICTIALSIHPLRNNKKILAPVLVVLFIAIWIEKGMGLIVPGFIPSPLGEIVEYAPTFVEIFVSLGIWAFGLLTLTILTRVGAAVLRGQLRYQKPSS